MGQLRNFTKLKYIFVLLIPAGIFFACSDDEYEEPDYSVGFPNAEFSHESSESNALTVNFTNTSDNGEEFLWDFGDGSGTSTEENPTYTYAAGGTYEVTLTVTNSRGTISKMNAITLSSYGDNLVMDGSMDDTGGWTYKQLWTADDNAVEHGFSDGAFKWVGAEGTAFSNAALYQEIEITAGQEYYFNMHVKSESGTANSWFEVFFGKDPVDGDDYGSGGAQAFIKSFGDGENCGTNAFEGDIYAVAAAGCPIPDDSKLSATGIVTFEAEDLTENGTIYLVIKAGNWDGNFGTGIIMDDIELRPVLD